MREKRRYVAFKAAGGWMELTQAVKKLEGEFGEPIKLVHYEHETGFGLLRCSLAQLPSLRSKIEKNSQQSIIILGISGTIRAAKRKFSLTATKG